MKRLLFFFVTAPPEASDEGKLDPSAATAVAAVEADELKAGDAEGGGRLPFKLILLELLFVDRSPPAGWTTGCCWAGGSFPTACPSSTLGLNGEELAMEGKGNDAPAATDGDELLLGIFPVDCCDATSP